MEESAPRLDTLLDLENRHEDLLRQLDELDKRVLGVLKECQPARPEAAVAE